MNVPGKIFLSHASSDKDFVAEVYRRLDASNTFYDIKSVYPGQPFIDAMKSGTTGSNVFVLFHSPNTVKTWVEYEKDLAELNHATKRGRVLVVPLGGETYHTLPDWMKGFMTCTEDFSVSDIVRQILFLQSEILKETSQKDKVFIGREDLCRAIHLQAMKNLQETGISLQHIVLSGLPGMGRSTVAEAVALKTLSSMRPAGPVFDLPDMAEAVDLYLAMYQDQRGILTKEEVEKQISAFERLRSEEMADYVFKLSKHWANLNQPITIKTRWGLRDRTRQIKPWLAKFIRASEATPSLRVFYVTERRFPDEVALHVRNLAQFHVDQLSDLDIQYILGELIDPRYYDAGKSETLARNIYGHPATAIYAARLVRQGKNFDTINENPEPIFSFQDKVLGAIFHSGTLSEVQNKILALLGVFPKLSVSILARVIEVPRKQLAEEMWELQESSLIEVADANYYSCPGLVASRARKDLRELGLRLLEEVRVLIQQDVDDGRLDAQLIDALLIASTERTGEVPQQLSGLLTSSSLLTLVTDRFFRARDMSGNAKDVFLSAYNLSKLAINMNTSDDAVEQILFTGGDSAIRAGMYPDDIIGKMTDMALPSVYYLKGSYAFHVKKDDAEAAENLKRSLEMKHFRLRNARLLARALIRSQDFFGALRVLNDLPKGQLERETGLILQKIRALRGMRNHAEADQLEKVLEGRDDEYGEINIYNAGKSLRDGDYEGALEYLKRAEESPKANRFNHQLLKCAVLLEKGDASLLPFVVETANAVNRRYEAHQLQARHAVVQGNWQDAEAHLREIDKKDFFDLQIEYRMLKLKMEDPQIKNDVAAMQDCQAQLEEVLRKSVTSPEGYRSA